MSEKRDCYWYKRKTVEQRGCGVLNCLQCKVNGTCSFYETEKDYEARRQAFDEKQNNKIRIRCGFLPFARQIGREYHDTMGGKAGKR